MTDFEKGAEAMRERIGLRIAHVAHVENWHPRLEQELTDAIRGLPLPVQPPGSESREARLEKALRELCKSMEVRPNADMDAGVVQLVERGAALHRALALIVPSRPEEKK